MLGLFQGWSDLQPESGNKTQQFEAQLEAKLVPADRPIVLDGNITRQAGRQQAGVLCISELHAE